MEPNEQRLQGNIKDKTRRRTSSDSRDWPNRDESVGILLDTARTLTRNCENSTKTTETQFRKKNNRLTRVKRDEINTSPSSDNSHRQHSHRQHLRLSSCCLKSNRVD